MKAGARGETLIELPSAPRSVEWPTVLLIVAIYGGWLALTYWHASVPAWLLVSLGSWLVCWHSSLQHEILHGHPTRSAAINRAIGYLPLALWLPYDRYRCLHLKHHDDERLTDPLDDPESRYLTPEAWQRLGAAGRTLVAAQGTLLGRLTIGPFWVIATFLREEMRDVIRGEAGSRLMWAWHMVAVSAILGWLRFVCHMPVWFYLIGFALGGTSLMLIRSFAEHRAHLAVIKRTAMVDSHGPLAWLFLFNNLHAAHHARPATAWYRLPALFRRNRDFFTDASRGPYYKGYREIFRRFLIARHDTPVHPLGRVPAQPRRNIA